LIESGSTKASTSRSHIFETVCLPIDIPIAKKAPAITMTNNSAIKPLTIFPFEKPYSCPSSLSSSYL